jgi:hypothetical protein
MTGPSQFLLQIGFNGTMLSSKQRVEVVDVDLLNAGMTAEYAQVPSEYDVPELVPREQGFVLEW